MRWLGGLIGGALAVVAIVLAVGVPSIVEPVAPEPVAQRPMPDSPPHLPASPEPEPEQIPDPVSLQPLPEPGVTTPEPAPVQRVPAEPETVVAQPTPAQPVEPLRWHAFWSPFRSQIAANGFVSQLQTVTGLDYRVVTVKPGVYEVAFGYQEETEIAQNLAQIAAATGLDVPES